MKTGRVKCTSTWAPSLLSLGQPHEVNEQLREAENSDLTGTAAQEGGEKRAPVHPFILVPLLQTPARHACPSVLGATGADFCKLHFPGSRATWLVGIRPGDTLWPAPSFPCLSLKWLYLPPTPAVPGWKEKPLLPP